MATNLAIDDKLIEIALKLGNHKTKKEAVTTALNSYIQHKQQQEMICLFGHIDYDDSYDYKKERSR
jgi:hypothetical protein